MFGEFLFLPVLLSGFPPFVPPPTPPSPVSVSTLLNRGALFTAVVSVSGDVLFQMAEVHRQIQVQLEEMVGIPSSGKGVFFFLSPCRLGSPTLQRQLRRRGGAFNYAAAPRTRGCDPGRPPWGGGEGGLAREPPANEIPTNSYYRNKHVGLI